MIHREEIPEIQSTRQKEGSERQTERERDVKSIYRDVMSLRAWSSSSLMALYFSF